MDFDLLKKLCETPGVSGVEEQIRKVVANELKPLVDELSVDAMGNLIGIKRGAEDGPRVMVACHIDEIGFRVRHIDDKGFARVLPVGGWDPRNMVAQRVLVHGYSGKTLPGVLMPGAKPAHLLTAEEANKSPKIDDFFIDFGRSVADVKASVEIGDMVTMDRTCERIGDVVVSKALDNRLSVFIVLEALKALGDAAINANLYIVATTQEEVGLRGAITSAYSIDPHIGIALDVTLAVDIPGSADPDHVTKLGAGTAIKIKDSSLICNPKIVRHFRDICEEKSISYQLELLPRGGTDAGGIQRSRGGVPSFTLSTPTRYIHTVNETAHWGDIGSAVAVLSEYFKECHTRDYGYSLEF